ncbi:MAG: DUF11 domain-containing protein [Gemmatimonadetes bacterium]|nr:DUF11 domain-containing protein [Gemmatimonadota bacterium]
MTRFTRILTALASALALRSSAVAAWAETPVTSTGIPQRPLDFDVGVRKTGPGPLSIGQTATFTLNLINTGPAPVDGGSGVVVTDTRPSNYTAPVTATGTGWSCSVAGLIITCTYTGPAVGAQLSLPAISIQATARTSGEFTNCAGIRLNGAADANLQDNRDCRSYVVVPAQTGSITIVKDARPNDSQAFSFTSSTANIAPFSLDDDGNNATLSSQHVISGLPAGSYAFTQGYVPGWTLTDIVCTSSTDTPGRAIFDRWGRNVSSRTVTVNLDAGANVAVGAILKDPVWLLITGERARGVVVGMDSLCQRGCPSRLERAPYDRRWLNSCCLVSW